MSDADFNHSQDTNVIFSDPVAYLARFGIEAELIVESSMPAAA